MFGCLNDLRVGCASVRDLCGVVVFRVRVVCVRVVLVCPCVGVVVGVFPFDGGGVSGLVVVEFFDLRARLGPVYVCRRDVQDACLCVDGVDGLVVCAVGAECGPRPVDDVRGGVVLGPARGHALQVGSTCGASITADCPWVYAYLWVVGRRFVGVAQRASDRACVSSQVGQGHFCVGVVGAFVVVGLLHCAWDDDFGFAVAGDEWYYYSTVFAVVCTKNTF